MYYIKKGILLLWALLTFHKAVAQTDTPLVSKDTPAQTSKKDTAKKNPVVTVDNSKRNFCNRPLGKLQVDTIAGNRFLVDSTGNIVGAIGTDNSITMFPCMEKRDTLWMIVVKVGIFLVIILYVVLVGWVMNVRHLTKESTLGLTPEERRYKDEQRTLKSYITSTISIILLITFVFTMITLFLVNCVIDISTVINEKWFEAFKNFLILLGTSFTTIMGYFFGQGQAEKLESKNTNLQNTVQELHTKNEELKDTEVTADEQIAQLEKQLDVVTNKWQEAIKKLTPTEPTQKNEGQNP